MSMFNEFLIRASLNKKIAVDIASWNDIINKVMKEFNISKTEAIKYVKDKYGDLTDVIKPELFNEKPASTDIDDKLSILHIEAEILKLGYTVTVVNSNEMIIKVKSPDTSKLEEIATLTIGELNSEISARSLNLSSMPGNFSYTELTYFNSVLKQITQSLRNINGYIIHTVFFNTPDDDIYRTKDNKIKHSDYIDHIVQTLYALRSKVYTHLLYKYIHKIPSGLYNAQDFKGIINRCLNNYFGTDAAFNNIKNYIQHYKNLTNYNGKIDTALNTSLSACVSSIDGNQKLDTIALNLDSYELDDINNAFCPAIAQACDKYFQTFTSFKVTADRHISIKDITDLEQEKKLEERVNSIAERLPASIRDQLFKQFNVFRNSLMQDIDDQNTAETNKPNVLDEDAEIAQEVATRKKLADIGIDVDKGKYYTHEENGKLIEISKEEALSRIKDKVNSESNAPNTSTEQQGAEAISHVKKIFGIAEGRDAEPEFQSIAQDILDSLKNTIINNINIKKNDDKAKVQAVYSKIINIILPGVSGIIPDNLYKKLAETLKYSDEYIAVQAFITKVMTYIQCCDAILQKSTDYKAMGGTLYALIQKDKKYDTYFNALAPKYQSVSELKNLNKYKEEVKVDKTNAPVDKTTLLLSNHYEQVFKDLQDASNHKVIKRIYKELSNSEQKIEQL